MHKLCAVISHHLYGHHIWTRLIICVWLEHSGGRATWAPSISLPCKFDLNVTGWLQGVYEGAKIKLKCKPTMASPTGIWSMDLRPSFQHNNFHHLSVLGARRDHIWMRGWSLNQKYQTCLIFIIRKLYDYIITYWAIPQQPMREASWSSSTHSSLWG